MRSLLVTLACLELAFACSRDARQFGEAAKVGETNGGESGDTSGTRGGSTTASGGTEAGDSAVGDGGTGGAQVSRDGGAAGAGANHSDVKCSGATKPCGDLCIAVTECCKECSGATPVCKNGNCVSSTPSCPSGQGYCGGECVDTDSTASHCGSSCEVCQSASPKCYAGSCVACLAGRDCPGSESVCTDAHTCQCHAPSAGNVLQNPGFGAVTKAANWSPSPGTTWQSDDYDGCPGSGSITVVVTPQFDFGNFTQCAPVASSKQYHFGFAYTQEKADSLLCTVYFYSDTNCSTSVVGGSITLQGISAPVQSFMTTSATTTSPATAKSAAVTCQTSDGKGTFDQLYLNGVSDGY